MSDNVRKVTLPNGKQGYKIGKEIKSDLQRLSDLKKKKKWELIIKQLVEEGFPISPPQYNIYRLIATKDWDFISKLLHSMYLVSGKHLPKIQSKFPESMSEYGECRYIEIDPIPAYWPEEREILARKAIRRLKKKYFWVLKQNEEFINYLVEAEDRYLLKDLFVSEKVDDLFVEAGKFHKLSSERSLALLSQGDFDLDVDEVQVGETKQSVLLSNLDSKDLLQLGFKFKIYKKGNLIGYKKNQQSLFDFRRINLKEII
ncbi:MAG: hypothetical protein R3Y43_03480 [Alphaproteobacteria bacterium]